MYENPGGGGAQPPLPPGANAADAPGCNIVILPKYNHIYPNFALVLPKFRPNFALSLPKFARKNSARRCASPAPTALV